MTKTAEEVKSAINITSIFMVPTLKIPKEELKGNGFINGYIRDDVKGMEYKDAIYVLFKPSQLDRFREFLDSEYERTKHVIDDYDHKGGFVVVVYKLNMKFKKDFQIVREGKYSQTSIEFQDDFPKTIRVKRGNREMEETTLQYKIFNKTEDLVEYWEEKLGVELDEDVEAWHGWKEEDEILTEKVLKQYE